MSRRRHGKTWSVARLFEWARQSVGWIVMQEWVAFLWQRPSRFSHVVAGSMASHAVRALAFDSSLEAVARRPLLSMICARKGRDVGRSEFLLRPA